MKKVIVLVLIAVLAIGAYFGYYGFQRKKINESLKILTDYECVPGADDPILRRTQEELCANMQEVTEQYKQAASSSKTEKEFEQKIMAIENANDEKISEIIAAYNRRVGK